MLRRGVDKTGNVEQERSLNVTVDAQPPATAVQGNIPVATNANVTIILAATDLESGVAGTFFRVVRDKDKPADFRAGTSLTVGADSGDGNYTVQYFSVDNVNNSENVKEVSFKIDTRLELKMGFEGEPSVSTSSYNLAGKTEPGSTVKVGSADVKLSADGSFAHKLNLKPGKNKVTIRVTDPAGNTVENVVTITYNEPDTSTGWLLVLAVIAIAAGAVGAGIFLYKRRAGPPPPPPGRNAPATRKTSPPVQRPPRPPPPDRPLTP